jgi:hypothetical protein
MRIISTLIVAALATSLTGCISYSRHDREERVVEHRSGSYRGERSHSDAGYYRGDHHDHHRHGDYRHHPRGH